MPPTRKWDRLQDLAVLYLYYGKYPPDAREALALSSALERSPNSIGARLTAFASLDAANPADPAAKPPPSPNRSGLNT